MLANQHCLKKFLNYLYDISALKKVWEILRTFKNFLKYFYFSQFLKGQLISTCLRWFTYFSHDNRWDLEKKLHGVVTIVASSSVSFDKLTLLLQVSNINIKLFCCLWKLFWIVHVIAIWAIETPQFFKALYQSSSTWLLTCLLESSANWKNLICSTITEIAILSKECQPNNLELQIPLI